MSCKPYKEYKACSRLLQRGAGKWNKKLDIAPKDWRHVVVTDSKLKGCCGSVLECYVGYSPRSVLEKHYFLRLTSI